MIKTEYMSDGLLIRHYSDNGFALMQVETGVKYSEPIDKVPCIYTYTETDEPIDGDALGQDISSDEFYAMLKEVL